jgi:hypothetical protein
MDGRAFVQKRRARSDAPCRPGGFVGLFLLISFAFSASAQSYSIDWYKIASGGGTSTGGVYSASGTIGQPDAGGPLTGGNNSLIGGFWALVSVVQTSGAPRLTLTHAGGSVIVSWPASATGWTLQQNPSLAAPGWVQTGGSIVTLDGTNRVTVSPPVGNLFFRLSK